jgi:hypothetical protein
MSPSLPMLANVADHLLEATADEFGVVPVCQSRM